MNHETQPSLKPFADYGTLQRRLPSSRDPRLSRDALVDLEGLAAGHD
jgi:hypothetical protein